jgi:DNA-binding Lrp family transcriptional regulator
MKNLLRLLEDDCSLNTEQLAALAGMTEEETKAALEDYKKQGILLGYEPIINWDLYDEEYITALIEVTVIPQRGDGYDRIAQRIYQYEEVESLYLMSGSFDLCVIISGHSLKQVALFVSQKLSTIEGVSGTATHFILKKYKEKRMIFKPQEDYKERFVLD